MGQNFDHDVDVLVVGSGGGGLLAAAVAASSGGKTLVVEKSAEFGGTTATSGGGIWIADSDPAREIGIKDSIEAAFAYVRALTTPEVPDEPIRAYLTRSPEMLRWLHANTPIRYISLPYPDYYADIEGVANDGYRTHLPLPIDGRALGDDILNLRGASPVACLFGRINWLLAETQTVLFRPKGWQITVAKMIARYVLDIRQRIRSRKDRNLTNGTALVGGLFMTLKRLGVPVWLNTPLVDLIREDGRVIGAVVRKNGKEMRIHARRGVILAAGGFERNANMRDRYLPCASDPSFSGSQENNTGDAITIAEHVGAQLGNMTSTWASPVFRVPGENRARPSFVERALPGSIIVDTKGKRYLNEALSYQIAGQQMVEHDGKNRHSWFVFDATYRFRYPAGPLQPLIPDWLQARGVRAILKKASTIEGLARKIGVPQHALTETIRTFNGYAASGIDKDFARGDGSYERLYGDQRCTPNSTMAPLKKAPFFALPIWGGDIGTNGGVVTDEYGRALDMKNTAIPGLYVIGNAAASIMGTSYPGAGVTIGPALTFGYIAALHAMEN